MSHRTPRRIRQKEASCLAARASSMVGLVDSKRPANIAARRRIGERRNQRPVTQIICLRQGAQHTPCPRNPVPVIEGFWSLIKRGMIGTFHKVSKKYLPLYVAEFQFRYNNRLNADIFGTAIEGC
ncbi:MAG: transposase [Roseiarcus sp.]